LSAIRYELTGIGLLALGALGFAGYWGRAGVAGSVFLRVSRYLFGEYCWWLLPTGIAAYGLIYVITRKPVRFGFRKGGAILLGLTAVTILHGTMSFENATRGYGGGVAGGAISVGLTTAFGSTGRIIAIVVMAVISLMMLTKVTLVGGLLAIWRGIAGAGRAVKRGFERFLFVEEDEEDDEGEDPDTTMIRPVTSPRDGEDDEPPIRIPERKTEPRPRPPRVERPEEIPPPVLPGTSQIGMDQSLLYQVPPLSLLDKGSKAKPPKSDRDIAQKSRLLEETLESFDVKAKVIDVRQGPTVTRYEVQPSSGVKVASIVKLANDIALAMASGDVRIEAPIPNKSAVGIEIPNREISVVTLREVLESPEFTNARSKLTVALGKDIAGKPVISSLESMVHLLIAGATGSGKSVCINSIIASLLYRAKPNELKFLMIDPKIVELSVYNGIPHLLAPVVTDPAKAAKALGWVIKEMTRRYEAFAAAGVRDIVKFNDHVAQSLGKPDHMALPYIVVIIDELADLMVVSPVDVEDAIFRLAQMARAAGIHLVVATQRPSVDVLTGTIKANIQSRTAFAVASQVDSRTILDSAGAEKLLGRGDMLFFPIGAPKPLRAQGAYISEEEIEEIVRYIACQGEPKYEEAILKAEVQTETASEETDDDLFPQAVRIIVEAGQASVSLLQRRLPIGYTRAARLIDVMELRGYIGPYEGSKPREVFLTLNEYMRIFDIKE
jgi:DNA segregation ATPase FtsK/SpoIIIE, S-DNA-T family